MRHDVEAHHVRDAAPDAANVEHDNLDMNSLGELGQNDGIGCLQLFEFDTAGARVPIQQIVAKLVCSFILIDAVLHVIDWVRLWQHRQCTNVDADGFRKLHQVAVLVISCIPLMVALL
jgi:hypothetical protein